ncbi:4'-phosphopantetheinyl transferase family protein [Flavobacterium chilense]|uniref:4'-phosphopantetheinyl transferase n=1 Tax=Flavobacterium chilense TaxID=946677 RepID=A0A1M6XEC9_9FLAO|nr:4'-phosphopantetheinyl transferase superfamily protein [Flavobacterium chilense]SHL04278.1 4'-phosphopantetheinyl transferase [Flavobacterium chilense]
MIHLYYTYLSKENHEKLLQNSLAKFPSDFQDRIKKFRRWQDAQFSLLGRVMLFKGIEEVKKQNCDTSEIKYTMYNKPYFEDSLVQFNISHSGEIVVCALSDEHQMGIDIEAITNIELQDFKSQMTEKEWRTVNDSNDKRETFFNYWTQKEAVIKAHGHGLSVPLKSFEIRDNTTQINDQVFYLKEVNIDKNYKCYISSKINMKEVIVKKYNTISNLI